MVKYDLLVYLGLVPVVAVIMFAGFVILVDGATSAETRLHGDLMNCAKASRLSIIVTPLQPAKIPVTPHLPARAARRPAEPLDEAAVVFSIGENDSSSKQASNTL